MPPSARDHARKSIGMSWHAFIHVLEVSLDFRDEGLIHIIPSHTDDLRGRFTTYFRIDLGDNLIAASTVYRCDGDFWCCSAGTNSTSCCPTASDKFALKQGSRALIQNGTSFNKGYALVSIVDSSTLPASTFSTPPSSAQPAAATRTDASTTATGQFSSSTAPVATTDIDGEKLKVGLGAGLGIGIPLLIALLASLFLLASEKRKNRSLRDEIQARDLHFLQASELPPTKQPYPRSYPELSAQEPAVSELANHHRAVPQLN